jgi:hypothetical protein
MNVYIICICTWTVYTRHTLTFTHNFSLSSIHLSVIPSHPGVLIMFLFWVKKCSLPKCTCYTLSKSNLMYGTVIIFSSISAFKIFKGHTIYATFFEHFHSTNSFRPWITFIHFLSLWFSLFSSESSRMGLKPCLSAVVGARYANNLALHHPYLVMSQAYIL